ncbi:1-acyl-sn-glycerol-3-phosphate acyltransferase [Desulfovibrio sp. OttesenSCG-928-C06]|nr:1-acyl-sn-glycerol-3-phosphate acyltransferase [Desulfovibrio sp. OttesenSCG-928-C06]
MLLKRCYFWFALVSVTIVCLLAALPSVLLAWAVCRVRGMDPARGARFVFWWYGKLFRFLARPVMPVRVVNPDMAARNQPCIIVPNHQSFMDLYLFSAQHCSNLCFVVTSWPFSKLFFFALMMRQARYIRVGSDEDILNFAQRCREEIAAGSTIVCFPEGTRSRSGRLLPFKSGIFRVAAETGTRLVPMVYYNTGKFCPPGSFKVNPQRIFVKLLEPVAPLPGLEHKQAYKDLAQRVREAMLAELDSFSL